MFNLVNVEYKKILNIEKLFIPAFKITCILGESGSGKTTLLKMLNNMISCDSGEIYYQNTLLESIDSVQLRRDVVMLPQIAAIFPGTVKDNLLLGLKFSEKPLASDEEMNYILNFIYLKKDLKENAEKLSGGEKQRLALGRVLLMNPSVFLLDEPSSSLDESTEQIIIEKLVTYTKTNNKTLIIVTHSKKIAEQFSEYTITLKSGKIIS